MDQDLVTVWEIAAAFYCIVCLSAAGMYVAGQSTSRRVDKLMAVILIVFSPVLVPAVVLANRMGGI